MNLIDTHAHTYLEQFEGDYINVTQRAIDAGVTKILLPNVDLTSVKPMLDLYISYTNTYSVMTGLHPTSVKENWKEELNNIISAIHDYKPVAVGEIGIDLYWDKTYFDQQKEAFITQIEYAKEKQLPIVIHSRNSLDIIIDLIKPYKGDIKGVFHCFPGSVQQAKKVVDMGFLLGIGGVVTFKNSKMASVAEYLPLETIVLETDAPYLTPQNERGKRNESAFLIHIATFIAEKRNVKIDELAEVTTTNAKKLFNI